MHQTDRNRATDVLDWLPLVIVFVLLLVFLSNCRIVISIKPNVPVSVPETGSNR